MPATETAISCVPELQIKASFKVSEILMSGLARLRPKLDSTNYLLKSFVVEELAVIAFLTGERVCMAQQNSPARIIF
jgi:hypothetical protein